MQTGTAFIHIPSQSVLSTAQNLEPFCGEPLFVLIAKTLAGVSNIDKVVICTSDNNILANVLSISSPKVSAFKADETSWSDAHELFKRENQDSADFVVNVDPRYPYFNAQDVDTAIEAMRNQQEFSHAKSGFIAEIPAEKIKPGFVANGGISIERANQNSSDSNIFEILTSKDCFPVGYSKHHFLFGQAVYREMTLREVH